MGELKPVGSEKLQGDAKVKRILELTYYQSSTDTKKTTEVIKETTTGVYGIVKEKDGFYVKKGLNESSLDYIGGLFMKNKNKYSSYIEAFKKLEFLVEQEKLDEAMKYVLKTKKPEPKPQEESPAPMPTDEVPPAPADTAVPPTDTAAPTDELGGEELPTPEGEPEGEEDFKKSIQSAASKLQEKLRKYEEKLESEDIKAAIMQVLSGIEDLDEKLEDDDKDEIVDKFEPEEDAEETSDDALPTDEVPGEETSAPAEPEGEMGEENDGIAKLEELIGTSFFDDEPGSEPFDDEDLDDLGIEDDEAMKVAKNDYEKEYAGLDDEEEEDLEDRPEGLTGETDPEFGKEEETDERVKELDIDELTNMVNTGVKETLSKYFQ